MIHYVGLQGFVSLLTGPCFDSIAAIRRVEYSKDITSSNDDIQEQVFDTCTILLTIEHIDFWQRLGFSNAEPSVTAGEANLE